jgi:hypothetical protein
VQIGGGPSVEIQILHNSCLKAVLSCNMCQRKKTEELDLRIFRTVAGPPFDHSDEGVGVRVQLSQIIDSKPISRRFTDGYPESYLVIFPLSIYKQVAMHL